MFDNFFFKSRDFFNVKTDPEGHVILLRLKIEFTMSHDSFKCPLKDHMFVFHNFCFPHVKFWVFNSLQYGAFAKCQEILSLIFSNKFDSIYFKNHRTIFLKSKQNPEGHVIHVSICKIKMSFLTSRDSFYVYTIFFEIAWLLTSKQNPEGHVILLRF